jgi:putative flippase GtrA
VDRTTALQPAAARAARALRTPANWLQLAKFAAVGASGYVVNLGVYAVLLKGAGLHYAAAATCSFLVAASWNYTLNRHWTFRAERGHFGVQGMRFFVVSGLVYGANLGLLSALIVGGSDKLVAQAIAIVLVMPLNFVGNKLWSFRRR